MSCCERAWPQCVRNLLVQQVEEPAEERRIATTGYRRSRSIDGEVSQAVREQYEENPYPRWIKAGPPLQRAILVDPSPGQTLDVLIAGCGTGLSTIELARQARDAHVVAIDLSLASLSYAKRMAQNFDIGNVEFAHADITRLGSIGRAFDFIDASGVLHHLADPWEGWRVLLSLLRSGGIMQVGLYSELARQNVVAARALIAARGYRPILEDIRRCRQDIMAADDSSVLKSVTLWADFFSADECRDLLFHVQEHRIGLPQIKAFLAENGAQFAGFVLDRDRRPAFRGALSRPGSNDRSRLLAQLRNRSSRHICRHVPVLGAQALEHAPRQCRRQAAIAGAGAGTAALPRSQSRAARCATAISASDI